MQTEFYRSQTDLIPTFSLVLAVSLVGLNSNLRETTDAANGVAGIQPPMSRYSHIYYERSYQTVDQAEQIAALRKFAEGLLKETEDSPQGVVDIVNRHFWDLV